MMVLCYKAEKMNVPDAELLCIFSLYQLKKQPQQQQQRHWKSHFSSIVKNFVLWYIVSRSKLALVRNICAGFYEFRVRNLRIAMKCGQGFKISCKKLYGVFPFFKIVFPLSYGFSQCTLRLIFAPKFDRKITKQPIRTSIQPNTVTRFTPFDWYHAVVLFLRLESKPDKFAGSDKSVIWAFETTFSYDFLRWGHFSFS